MIDLDIVKIPGGTFLMGSPDEYPQHLVTISSFWMSKTTITVEQWNFVANLPIKNRVLDRCPSKNGDKYLVINARWEEAVEFCDRLSIFTGKNYRLPSEAEWEYACRAGTTTAYFFGDNLSENQANFYHRGKENRLMPVGQFPPNAFGLYDMHGNVWEWCLDNWHNNYEGAPTDGRAWLSDSNTHVLRGGSWLDIPWRCRSAYRGYGVDLKFCYDIGFRVAISNP
jgi:formylglycine-generating enzyme required for sulfatase activity